MSWLKLIFLPSKLILFLSLIAVIFFVIRRWRRYSFIPFITAAVLYAVFGSGWTAALLLAPLEYKHPALKTSADYPGVKHIVVLTAYAADDPLMPLSGKFNGSSLFRLVEAQNLYRVCSGCKIIISGTGSYVDLMHQQLRVFGIPETDIEDDPIAGHTADSADSLVTKMKEKQFFLVTSAGHMPRSMGVFKKNGFKPIPAPTDYLMPKDFLQASLMPDSQHLYFSDLAVNEYAGMLWYTITNRM